MRSDSQWSNPASDTGDVLDGTALGALLGGNGATAGFSIDYERLPQAIADLEHAAEFFEDRAKTAYRLGNLNPPGTDGVSMNAAQQIGRWASDSGTNNLHATLTMGSGRLDMDDPGPGDPRTTRAPHRPARGQHPHQLIEVRSHIAHNHRTALQPPSNNHNSPLHHRLTVSSFNHLDNLP
jgi:hypothetical protein